MTLDLWNPVIDAIPVGVRVLDGFFQATAVRAAGFSIVPLAVVAPGLKVLYVVMMYISVCKFSILFLFFLWLIIPRPHCDEVCLSFNPLRSFTLTSMVWLVCDPRMSMRNNHLECSILNPTRMMSQHLKYPDLE